MTSKKSTPTTGSINLSTGEVKMPTAKKTIRRADVVKGIVTETREAPKLAHIAPAGAVHPAELQNAALAQTDLAHWDARISNGYNMQELLDLGQDIAWHVWNEWGAGLRGNRAWATAKTTSELPALINDLGLVYGPHEAMGDSQAVNAYGWLWQLRNNAENIKGQQDVLDEVMDALELLQRVANAQRMLLTIAQNANDCAIRTMEHLATVNESTDQTDRNACRDVEDFSSRSRSLEFNHGWGDNSQAGRFKATKKRHAENRASGRNNK